MIRENVEKILEELPKGVILVAATKARTIFQIEEVISAGIKIIGENYVSAAQEKFEAIRNKVKWHLIGHLQRNKAKKAVKIFDMIETLDSLELAKVLNEECGKIDKIMPVLIEVNIAKEPQKKGIYPQNLEDFVKELLPFRNLKLMGLMTMGPLVDDPESIRPFFKRAKEIFEQIKGAYGEKLDWKYLSMGMSDTYKIAIQEGANIVRVGTAIFGSRD